MENLKTRLFYYPLIWQEKYLEIIINLPLKKAGKEKGVLIVSVDGGCPGIASVKSGVIGATSQQYPLLMASKGIEAIAAWAKDGTKPSASDGLNFFNTGVNLVTDSPVAGVPSIDSTKGTELCWG